MKTITVVMSLMFMSSFVAAQTNEFKMKLWPNDKLQENGITEPEKTENDRISNVSIPDITVYPADKEKNTGKSVLICPGGGYARLAIKHEGSDFAEWLSKNGITGVVLKYRMPNHHHTLPLEDAKQAMRMIRENAASWGINPHETGVMGFSAGGHLASTLLTHFDSVTRPDFGILFYPVITFDPGYTHQGSVNNLLGKEQTPALITYFSNEEQVTRDTPPTLLLHSDDDKTVPVDNALLFYNALRSNHVRASLHIFPIGEHGWGYKTSFPYHELMKSAVLEWIERN
ncbi:MAG: alpha/beta hydrolase [Candidatus Symbiothrix sp.]|jgi:acetyl esterase/lipase|nr:alpha/beta hydrolase [Candidatus Symbiothrix sp.]